jgi:type II secretory ATPase GspE/PulE/Tfp pilus assembly ATPase PilB-like protein
MHKGRPALPNPGYGAAASIKGTIFGLKPIVVSKSNELLSLDLTKEGAVISGKIGNKRRLELLNLASEKNITLLNVKDSSNLIQKIKDSLTERKKSKQDKLKKSSEKEAEKKKKAEKKKEKEKNLKSTESVEDKIEKSEKDKKKQKEIVEKIITKKQ